MQVFVFMNVSDLKNRDQTFSLENKIICLILEKESKKRPHFDADDVFFRLVALIKKIQQETA